jgi:hypothetical protein
MIVLLIKIIICFLSAIISYVIIKKNKVFDLSFYNIIILGFTIRWVFLIPWFLLMNGHGSGDVQSYETHIRWVIEGKIPNRDFITPYGFYFYYLLSIPYRLFSHPATVIIIIHFFELLGVILFCSAIARIISFDRAKLFALLYVTNPLVISWFAFDGQDEGLMIFAFGGIFFSTAISSKIFKAFYCGFSLFVVKITALAAIAPVLFGIKKKEVVIFLLAIILFLLPPVILGSEVFGFRFERENTIDELIKTVFPGNVWYLVNQVLSLDRVIFLSRVAVIFFLTATAILLISAARKMLQATFLAFGAVFFTLSYQLGSIYTSPGFIAAVVPFFIFLFLSEPELNKSKIYYFIFYSLIVSFDIGIYYRIRNEDNGLVGIIAMIFNFYQLIIIIANIVIFYFMFKYFIRLRNFNR